ELGRRPLTLRLEDRSFKSKKIHLSNGASAFERRARARKRRTDLANASPLLASTMRCSSNFLYLDLDFFFSHGAYAFIGTMLAGRLSTSETTKLAQPSSAVRFSSANEWR